MKVYIITKEGFPNGMAATNRIKCYARAIKEGGLDCEVVICCSSELISGNIKNIRAKGFYEGVPFRYIGGKAIDTRPKTIRRFFQFVKLIKTGIYLKQNLKKGDVLFLYMDGKVEWTLRFIKIAHKNGAYCVRDLCELPYGYGVETKKKIKLRNMTVEKQFPRLDGIISISSALLNYAQIHTPSICKHIKVPIMVEYELYKTDDRSSEVKEPYIFHAGTLVQQKDGILGIIKAFGMAKQRLQMPIRYILSGNIDSSQHASEIYHLIKQYHLEDSIDFIGYLFHEQIKEYLSKASLVISNRPKSKQNYYGFSTKVGEYLASGTPLIITRWGEAVNWLKDGKTAYIIEPDNTEALSDAIVHVFSNMEKARRIGKKGQDMCRNCFDYHIWSRPLTEYLKNLKK